MWAARLVMMTVTGPIITYIKGSTKVQTLLDQGLSLVETGLDMVGVNKKLSARKILKRDVYNIQQDISIVYQMLGILMVFGLHVPVLLVLSLSFVITNTIAGRFSLVVFTSSISLCGRDTDLCYSHECRPRQRNRPCIRIALGQIPCGPIGAVYIFQLSI